MLGKTNITTLSEGAVVTEIEDYNWIQMQSGVYGNFVKAVYANDYLAAITADGAIAYTDDGEVWQTSMPEYDDCKFNDIYWDGRRFIIVGSYEFTDTTSDKNYQMGLILTTTDFSTYEKVEIPGQFTIKDNERVDWVSEYLGIYAENSKYFVLGIRKVNGIVNSFQKETIYISRFSGDLENKWEISTMQSFDKFNSLFSWASNENKFIMSYSGNFKNGQYSTYVNEVIVSTSHRTDKIETKNNAENRLIPVFECKNELYYMRLYNEDNYVLSKVIETGEKIVLSRDINYGFVDGIYFNNCLIFINNHEMLVVKKGESIADKTLDDLIEIAPELTMNCIIKAFGQLFLFGNQGAVLKSSVETNNEDAIVVQTLSAKKALADAKKYTDDKYTELEARIAALELASEAE